MKQQIHLFIATLLLFAASCQKEKSVESGGGDGAFLGNNCQLTQILSLDSATGAGLSTHLISRNSNNAATRVQVFDSLVGLSLLDDQLVYRGDTVFAGNTGYFLLDSRRRVRSLVTFDDFGSAIMDTIRVVFSYNAAGSLVSKEYFLAGIPAPFVRSVYTYSGGNLIRSRMETLLPTVELIVESEITYNTNQQVRDFLYVFPDAFELAAYLPALNFGNKPVNSLQSITTKTYDINGNLEEVLTTVYRDYRFSRDGYVIELNAVGDLQEGLGFFSGKTKFSYSCR